MSFDDAHYEVSHLFAEEYYVYNKLSPEFHGPKALEAKYIRKNAKSSSKKIFFDSLKLITSKWVLLWVFAGVLAYFIYDFGYIRPAIGFLFVVNILLAFLPFATKKHFKNAAHQFRLIFKRHHKLSLSELKSKQLYSHQNPHLLWLMIFNVFNFSNLFFVFDLNKQNPDLHKIILLISFFILLPYSLASYFYNKRKVPKAIE